MLILFAVPSYWPSQDGVANITGYLAEGLVKRGHEVLILTSAGNGGLQELSDKEVHNNVKIERMRIYVRWPLRLKGRDKESTKKVYLKRIQTYQPDVLVVVCSQTWTFDWIKPHLDEIKCHKVFYAHGYSKWQDNYSYKEKLLKRNILGIWEQYLCKKYYDNLYKYINKYDLAIYLSEENNAVRYAKLHGLTNGKILENAIEDIFFEKKMKHEYTGEQSGKICFLFIANYNKNKNQEMLIEAYCNANIGKSKLIFAGFEENTYLNYLQEYVNKLFQTNFEKEVEFNIHLDRNQIVDLYKTSDIFVCPSESETWSIVAHEAAAVAMPIISTDVGIYSEIDGVIIVKNVKEMQEAIEYLYYNAEERRRRGLAAYEWLQKKPCRIEDKVECLENELKKLGD